MKRRRFVAFLAVGFVAALMLIALFVARRAATQPPDSLAPTVLVTSEFLQTPALRATAAIVRPTVTVVRPTATSIREAATTVVREWEWRKPGFSGWPAITVTQGIDHYVYYNWSSACDAPARHQLPMIWGKAAFYTDHVALAELFNGPCNDGRPLLFLNEPAKVEQADISPVEAAHMFYTMTRGVDWAYARWHGPIYAGNNLVEDGQWDRDFVRQFAKLYNGGSLTIPEIAGWAIHLYGNYEYGPKPGDPNSVWTEDIPPGDIPAIVDRSMRKVDEYLAERKAEGNSTLLLVTEFGLLQASAWHEPPTSYYETTASFMDEYVRWFDRRPEIQAWFSFISTSPNNEFLDTNLMIDAKGSLTPNGLKWRELAKARQGED